MGNSLGGYCQGGWVPIAFTAMKLRNKAYRIGAQLDHDINGCLSKSNLWLADLKQPLSEEIPSREHFL